MQGTLQRKQLISIPQARGASGTILQHYRRVIDVTVHRAIMD